MKPWSIYFNEQLLPTSDGMKQEHHSATSAANQRHRLSNLIRSIAIIYRTISILVKMKSTDSPSPNSFPVAGDSKHEGRLRASSASTNNDSLHDASSKRAESVFSEAPTVTSTATSPRSISQDDHELLEIDKETFEASKRRSVERDRAKAEAEAEAEAEVEAEDDGDDLVEIDEATFAATFKATWHDKQQQAAVHYCAHPENLRIINGSTLGGTDPLHALLRHEGVEPLAWAENRRMLAACAHHRSRKRSRPHPHGKPFNPQAASLDPQVYDCLPYSPQHDYFFSSGLDQNSEPERNGKEFWGKVKKAWDAQMRRESLEEYRESFEEDCFPDLKTPAHLRCV